MLQLDPALTFAFVGHDTAFRIDSVTVNVTVIVSECSNVTVDTSDSRPSEADVVVNETVTASGPEPTPVSRFIEIEVEMDRGRLTMRALPTVSTATLTKPYRLRPRRNPSAIDTSLPGHVTSELVGSNRDTRFRQLVQDESKWRLKASEIVARHRRLIASNVSVA